MHETAGTQLAQKERELLMSTNELASVTKELKAMQVRELELRDTLGRAHEVDLGLNAQMAVLTHKSDLLAQELEDGKASWTLERTSLRANATHHEVRGGETKGGTSRGKAGSGGAMLRLLSPDRAGRAQGSGMHMMMDTPIVGGGTAHVGSQMGERVVGSGISMTPLRGSSSLVVEPKKPTVEGTSEGLTAIAQQMISGPPAQVRLFVEHTRTKLRARTFMLDHDDRIKDRSLQGDAGQPRCMA